MRTVRATPRRPLVTARLGLVVAPLAPVVVLVAPWPVLALIAVLVFAFAGVGAGVMCWVDAGDAYAQAGLVLVLSLGSLALAATIMLWLEVWHPALMWTLAGGSAASCLCRLRSASRSGVA